LGDSITNVLPTSRVTAHRGHITCLQFSEDGKHLVSSGTDHGIVLWTVGTLFSRNGVKKEWENSSAHESVVSAVCFGKAGSANLIFSCSWDGATKVWDLKKGHPLQTLRGHRGKVTDVAVTNDGKFLLTAGVDCSILLWDLLNQGFSLIVKYTTPLSEGPFSCLNAGTSTFISGSANGMLRVWPLWGVDATKELFHAYQKPVKSGK